MDQGKATGSPAAEIVTPAPHTPTPWFRNGKCEVGPRPRTDDQSDGMLHPVADVFGDNAYADSAFIVKAVNSHNDLVNALAHCQRVLAMLVEPGRIMRTSSIHAWTEAVAADAGARIALANASSSSGPLMTDDSSRKDSGEVNQ